MMHIKVKQNRASKRILELDQLDFHSSSFFRGYVPIGKSLHFSQSQFLWLGEEDLRVSLSFYRAGRKQRSDFMDSACDCGFLRVPKGSSMSLVISQF